MDLPDWRITTRSCANSKTHNTAITAYDVPWRFASLHSAPVATDRSAPMLSIIMLQATEVYGYRTDGTKPARGIKRSRRQGRERDLSTAEVRRLGEAPKRYDTDPSAGRSNRTISAPHWEPQGQDGLPEMGLLSRGRAVLEHDPIHLDHNPLRTAAKLDNSVNLSARNPREAYPPQPRED